VPKCEMAVQEYLDGIALVREANSDFAEVTPDETVLKELAEKPPSWISKLEKVKPSRIVGNLEEIVEQSEGCNTTNMANVKSSFAQESAFSLDEAKKLPQASFVKDDSFKTAKSKVEEGAEE
jgi:hypothetical protein